MNEERKRILKMVEDGKISVEEADSLLGALGQDKPPKTSSAKFLRVRVQEGGSEKVNINVPISLAKVALRFIPNNVKNTLNEKKLDLDDILAEIESGMGDRKIVEVEDGDDRVEIFIE
ncbi:MAG: hypothetical protein UMV23_04175 [Halanaerobium sp.]|nr:hypothetical protein [Halanaerobium sp.]